jgi:hypothetical protein
MSETQKQQADSAASASDQRTRRSHSRERDNSPLMCSHAPAVTAAMDTAYANNPQSISRLHDDELLCMLGFLLLKDLAQLVRCSRRFNGVARKERSLDLRLMGGASAVPVPSSMLSHHVTTFRLHNCYDSDVFFTQDTLRVLKNCPHLTALELMCMDAVEAAALLEGEPNEQSIEALKAVLPTHLKSFSALLFSGESAVDQPHTLASVFCTAASVMTQLTELDIGQMESVMVLPTGVLRQHPRLRKLKLSQVRWSAELLAEVKQLHELRELILSGMQSHEIVTLCDPPHSWQLDTVRFFRGSLDAAAIRALLHLPTLTALDDGNLHADGWPLLPQLPLLRRLRLEPSEQLTAALTSSLSASLSGCKSLTDLKLRVVRFDDDATPEQIKARWTEILRGVPIVRRLGVMLRDLSPFLSALPACAPLLEHLWLCCLGGMCVEDVLPQMAHPSVRTIQLSEADISPSDERVRALLHSSRLPKLERIE